MESRYNLFVKKTQKRHFNSDNISFKNDFVFIHIPKNAGTAIGKSFSLESTKHNTVEQYVAALGEKRYKQMLSFAFVRNPFSRFLSLYNYARMPESYYHSAVKPERSIYGKHLDYEILKNASIEEAAWMLKEGKLKHNPPHIQWLPQVFWLKNKEGAIDLKYIGRFEDLELHLRNITEIIGVKKVKKLEKVNVSSNDNIHYRKLIDSNTRLILEDYYNEDLDAFNYEF